ncbi:lipid-A-disaccharide synthase [Candidatus Uabimicrobium amorphum]|uniref:Lipid-A-disaccharide synthase n=1 Tax=Uabimicrobium amorphum TaxID=2596890 RepID=A0A5S9ILD8_UABAM|nr:lipid-A-disaccharide synthase [Candidatus Uabimicrobium amorphum]BBM83680.1 lipid-A-disaccharide synthase [Candidatus Uabimicrobium amorphum]
MSKHIFIVAGEASGDIYGAQLISYLREIDPQIEVSCLGGECMKEKNVHFLYNLVKEFSVMGFIPVILGIPKVMRFLEISLNWFDKKRPDLIVLIDYPGFNMYLSTHAYRRKIPCIYFITPQIWAWAPWRIKKIKKFMSKMLVIFPFEVPFYEKANVPVSYVGHPILDKLAKFKEDKEFRQKENIEKQEKILAVLPGSREREIRKNLNTMLWVAENLEGVDHVIIALGSEKYIDLVNEIASEYKSLPLRIVLRNTHNVLVNAHLALVTSGTATLETALLKGPLVIFYKLPKLHHFVFKHLPFITCDFIGLPNIISDREIVPEHVFKEEKDERILEDARNLWQEGEIRQQCIKDIEAMRAKMGTPGASKRAAKEIMDFLNQK